MSSLLNFEVGQEPAVVVPVELHQGQKFLKEILWLNAKHNVKACHNVEEWNTGRVTNFAICVTMQPTPVALTNRGIRVIHPRYSTKVVHKLNYIKRLFV